MASAVEPPISVVPSDRPTTREFLRSFSVVDKVSDDDSDFDELSPIPESPGDILEDHDSDDGQTSEAEDDIPRIIPYQQRFRSPVAFSDQQDNCWIPGQTINITVVGFERQPALKMLNPNLYEIRVQHGDYEWTVHRRYKHFRQLHDALALFRARYRLPLPTKEHVQRRKTIMKDLKGMKKERKKRQQKSVRLPLRPDYLVSEDDIPNRMKQLEKYLQNLMTCKSYRNHPEAMKFFEVSPLSFIHKLGIKSKEGTVEKCSGGRRINIQCCGCLQNLHLFGSWKKRWLLVKDNFIAYIRPEDGQISDVMLMDSAFRVESGIMNTGAKHGVLVENKSRKLLLKCWTGRKAREWEEAISHAAKTHARDYTQKNRFNSFAPPREREFARWFVDGSSYFEAVADALEKAREEIYITDWWLSPEIYLKRPIRDGDKWRLDVVLKRKAEEGVKVFILLYKEIELSLTIKSIYSKQTLMSQCPENIKVLRHPDHIPGAGVLLWAHHEKLVIIDQQIAFAGGLDLCYGRWDDEHHRMTDLGHDHLKPKVEVNESVSDINMEVSSHTEVSMMASEENLSGPDHTPFVVISAPSMDSPEEDNNKQIPQDEEAQGDLAAMPGYAPEEIVSEDQITLKENKGADDNSQTTDIPSASAQEGVPSAHDANSSSGSRVPSNTLHSDAENLSAEHSTPASRNVPPSAKPKRLSSPKAKRVSHQSSPTTNPKSSPRAKRQSSPRTNRQPSPRSKRHASEPLEKHIELHHTSPAVPEGDIDDTAPNMSESDVDDTAPIGMPSPRKHIEPNVVVKSATSGSGARSQGSSDKEHEAETAGIPINSPDIYQKSAQRRHLIRQSSSVVDTEGFSESALEEINESMQPFKDIGEKAQHIAGAEHEDGRPVQMNPVYEDDSIDKEIVCASNAPDIPRGDDGKPSKSPVIRKKKIDSPAPNTAADSTAAKASHLWKRRSKDKSLELVIAQKDGTPEKTNQEGGAGENGAYLTPEESKLRANSDSSEASRNSNIELMTGKKRGKDKDRVSDGKTPKEPASPSTASSQGGMSLSGAASAMHALRKILHRKEENNNDNREDDVSKKSDADPSNAARRRWKMILNVSKFENIVRSPQVPERVDESLFYNQNVKFPSSKSKLKLVQSFKVGIDKLKKNERRGSTELYEAAEKVGRQNLTVLPGMHHTVSEEDILERGLVGSTKLWIGKDYVNFIYKDFVNLDQPFEDFIDRTKYPRMPWHDIGCVVYGKGARDLARHFIGRWNFTKLEKCKMNPNFPLLVPKTTSKVYIPRVIKDITFEVKLQVLRSVAGWSAGISDAEDSIHRAYEHCIESARDYIYIENQFFITQVGSSSSVLNVIGNALLKRILRAHRSNKPFKVYVVMPLLPAFEGEFGTNTGAALQAVTHWNMSSICRGGSSLMERLAQEIPDPNQYIVFCGLRSWDKLNGKLFTELIYVHSKLMIVDDDTVIIGSANINDRSLLGHRDSEIAVMFEDIHKVNVTVNDKPYQAGSFASSLRWTIFREHLGLLNETDFVDLTDITSNAFYKDIWIKRAAVNTTCYDKVFNCLPTDNVQNFTQLRQYQSVTPLAQTDEEESMKWLNKIRGHLVLIPLQFLREETLTPKVGQKEALLPTHLWT